MPLYPPAPLPPNPLLPEFSDGDIVYDILPEDDTIETNTGVGRVVMNGVVANVGAVSAGVDFIWIDWENELITVPNNATS